jgi:hypothetical protein
MPENSPLKKYAESQRPESLLKNLYKIDSPYDLTDDVVSKSLDLLRSLTGYDYRSNTLLNLVERLVDVQNSKLLIEGGQRLAVEFGRRALTRNLSSLIPTPADLTPNFKKYFKNQDYTRNDSFITDPEKNPSRSFGDKLLENTIGYIDNDSYLIKKLNTFRNQNPSLESTQVETDVLFYYLGDMAKEKIQQMNVLSVFSNYNTSERKFDFENRSKIFKNTYQESFINGNDGVFQMFMELYGGGGDTYYQKRYTKDVRDYYYSDVLLKDTEKEKYSLDIEQGFGDTELSSTRETNTDSIELRNSNQVNLNDFRYDSEEIVQNTYLEQNKVKRGLVYFTSKLAKESSVISADKKIIKTKNLSDGNIVNFYKGNGECRTFTVYDQYNNYGRLIRFKGNGQPNSVIRDSVMPRIAPMIGDSVNDRRSYFFTMENLAVKPGTDDDCDKGPNGGRWMWFAPYNVKLSDNNTINWADMNFLGRPEPIFSYQNTTRSLSLSFTLLVDTVAKHQDVATTIQNHYDYLYGCKEFPDTNQTPPPPPPPSPTPTPRPTPTAITSEEAINLGIKYNFKNDRYFVKTTNVDYTSGDTNIDYDIYGSDSIVSNLNTKKNNELFISNLNTSLSNLSSKITKDTNYIEIAILGAASELFGTPNLSEEEEQLVRIFRPTYNYKALEKNYNLALGMRRAYSLMKTIISQFNANYGTSELGTIDANTQQPKISEQFDGLYYFGEYETNPSEPTTKTFTYENNKKSCKIKFVLRTEGSAKSDNATLFTVRNIDKFIKERYANAGNAIIKSTKASESTAPELSQLPTNNSTAQQQAVNTSEPCDPKLTLDFQKVTDSTRFPIGAEKLKTFTPSFNSQTPFDFTKRYVFLHQLTRPSKLQNLTNIENTAFGRMPVFVLRYGDFIHSKAIAKSINFDLQESTWDLNPEGMGAIPLICNVTMDIMLLGGQSLAGPIDKIQTANDSAFIANTSFNSGRYKDNNRFKSVRDIEKEIYGDIVDGGTSSNNQTTSSSNTAASNATGGGAAANNATASSASAGNEPKSTPTKERNTNVPKKDKDKSKTQQTTNKNKDDKARTDAKNNSKEVNNPEIKSNLNKSTIPGLSTSEIQRVANLPAPSFSFNPNTSLQGDNTNIYRKAGVINKINDNSWETYLKNARQKK